MKENPNVSYVLGDTFQVQKNIVAIFHDKLVRKAQMLPRKQLWLAGTTGSHAVCARACVCVCVCETHVCVRGIQNYGISIP